jgi:4a-hydroxytetrahydrobiopterin dehydratase
MPRPPRLDDATVTAALATLPGWSLVGGKLHRALKFDDFAAAFDFMTRMALVSESLGHHPDWYNVYDRVVVDLHTHDAGGITELDLEWARRASRALDG